MQEGAHLIGLVVVLWVVLEDLSLLSVVKVQDKVVETEIFAPLLTLQEPVLLSAPVLLMTCRKV